MHGQNVQADLLQLHNLCYRLFVFKTFSKWFKDTCNQPSLKQLF